MVSSYTVQCYIAFYTFCFFVFFDYFLFLCILLIIIYGPLLRLNETLI